ncbi:MAG: membrane protein insertion efficiency factor YidD [Candidatus Omnitrophica bacterium]|nr:membrane protein insertion efficiency factor YidD [Candidatus Omnitrophota bacterium]
MRRLLIRVIKRYQQVFAFRRNIPRCKFHPSCSDYGILALAKNNIFLATTKIIWRLLRCNPFSRGGVDLP